MGPELIFPETWLLDGFTTNVTSRQAGEPDPVVRELLQNCLDAAIREARRDFAEVSFTIARRPLTRLPGYEAYVRAYKAAKADLKQPTTHDVRSATDRIDRVLERRDMSVLYCRDNGIGLDANRVKALLSEGQSDKATQGAGSYGLGHLTAYAASDLRYVLYAGRRSGEEICSGHAILASHMMGKVRHSAHGYWRHPTELFSLEDGNYPRTPPPLLADELSRIEDSGSVVAISGFNHFHEDDYSQALDDICRVAALNFMGAIWEGKMIVHVYDEESGRKETVDAGSLQMLLKPMANQQRARAAGWLPGQQGHRAWETMQSGETLDAKIDRSITIKFRRLPAGANERSRIQVFRDGMWISNDAPELRTGNFGGVRPFDAVVMLRDADPEDHTEFYDLVRNSEGPEHRGLTKMREMQLKDRRRLREMLRKVAQCLQDAAGMIDTDEGFTPEGFAVFNDNAAREASKTPKLRFRLNLDSDEDNPEPVTSPTGTTTEGDSSPDQPGQRTGRTHQRRAPSAGTAVTVRRAIVPQLNEEGSISIVRAQLEVHGDSATAGQLGLRVFVESGSDETCEQPLSPVWQSIREVRSNGTVYDGKGETEVVVPDSVQSLEIELAEPVGAASRFELDIVRRRAKGASK